MDKKMIILVNHPKMYIIVIVLGHLPKAVSVVGRQWLLTDIKRINISAIKKINSRQDQIITIYECHRGRM